MANFVIRFLFLFCYWGETKEMLAVNKIMEKTFENDPVPRKTKKLIKRCPLFIFLLDSMASKDKETTKVLNANTRSALIFFRNRC